MHIYLARSLARARARSSERERASASKRARERVSERASERSSKISPARRSTTRGACLCVRDTVYVFSLYTILLLPISYGICHKKGGSVGRACIAQWPGNSIAIG